MISKNLSDHPTFCVAPWLHAHVDSKGQRRLCCAATPCPKEFSDMNFRDFWDSDYMKDIRRKMLKGQLPTECDACANPSRINIYRDELNEAYADHIAQIEHLSEEDGSTQMGVVYIDYRDDLCNLKCRICNEDSSTTWQAHLRKYSEEFDRETNFKRFVDFSDRKSRNERNFQEFRELLKTQPVEAIYFAGGEPTIHPQHLEVLNDLVQSQQASKMTLYYSTNLSRDDQFMSEWMDLLDNFKQVYISISIDGFGDMGEYLRSGLSWKQFESNVSRLSLRRRYTLAIDPTITSLFYLDLIPFSQFCVKYRVSIFTKLMIGSDWFGGYLRVEFLPKDLREKLVNKWLDYYNSLLPINRMIFDQLKGTLLQSLELEEFPEEEWKRHYRMLRICEKTFKLEGFDQFAQRDLDFANWWKQKSR